MSNKSYCMLCNAELISLVQPPAEYGYLCAPCKVAVLCVGKNQIDNINYIADTMKSLKALPMGAFSGMNQVDAFGYGNNTFPVDLTKPAGEDATEQEKAYRQERTKPLAF